jgi:hypothetical protein
MKHATSEINISQFNGEINYLIQCWSVIRSPLVLATAIASRSNWMRTLRAVQNEE